ncbi:ComEC/Rec2 family competence protein [uncultured Clostridium sp.]|uniref:ComEC/Rec2 family competence protein n=1 Tax=uncultured Clostridium sp. TaxID=59620 RepID=UPI0028E3621F|nr:ComEC/Rec2 family competence protein [uncultured Clostridium sp.]
MKKNTVKKTARSSVKIIEIMLIVVSLIALLLFCTGCGKALPSVNSDTNLKNQYPINIYFFDVGKADSMLIECDGEYVLIDAGTADAADQVCANLKELGVKEIKTVFLSHPDKDHVGGMSAIIENFSIHELVQSPISEHVLPSTDEYESFIAAAEKYGLNNNYATVGDVYTVGSASLTVLAPLDEYGDTNNDSMVLKLEYERFSVLFCGDIEKKAEKDLVKSSADLSADVIKIPHHGSSNSSTEDFLKAVGASYAVISTGENSKNLPKKSVLKRIKNLGAEIYRTDINGNITCSYDGEKIILTTEYTIKE